MSFRKVLLVLSVAAFCAIMYMSTLEDELGELHCGVREERGSKPSDWPWQVSIMSRPNRSHQYRHSCGGAVISERWILTAAACVNVDNYTVQNNMAVLAGRQPRRQFWKIDDVILERGFDPDSNSNNVALVKLRQPLAFGDDGVGPVCLPCRIRTKNKRVGGCHATGYRRPDGGGPGLLQEERAEVVSHKACNEWYQYTVTPDKLCATRADPRSCMGPIGGPLSCFVPAEGRHFVLGVRIHSRGCGDAGAPDVYLDVTRYYYWVKHHTGVA